MSETASQEVITKNEYVELDIKGVLKELWNGKLLLTSVTLIFSVASVLYSLSLPNIYRSSVLVSPSKGTQGGGMSAITNQFGSLAGLAGISISGSSSEKVDMAIAVLRSRKFVQAFILKHDLLVPLVAAKAWDRSTNTLKIDRKIYDVEKKEWVREVVSPKLPQPSTQEAYRHFIEKCSISQDKKSGLVTISINHLSPYVAQQWVTLLVDDINQVMKKSDVDEAAKSIKYLQDQLEATSISEMKKIFYQLIEEQSKTIMLANVRDEYVFKTIDPAIVAEEKESPRRSIICIFGAFLGIGSGVALIFLRRFYFSLDV